MAGLVDRRVFLQASLAAGLAVVVRPLAASAQSASLHALATASDSAWQGSTTTAARRIDGRAKVVGAKLYAADFRATGHAGLAAPDRSRAPPQDPRCEPCLRGARPRHADSELTPDRVVLAADLAKAGITVPPFYAGDLLCPSGKTPLYLGQPVALLIWNDFARFLLAKRAIRLATGVLRFGAATGPVAKQPYAAPRFVRVAGPTSGQRGRLFADAQAAGPCRSVQERRSTRNGRRRRRPAPVRAAASYYGDQIRAEIDAAQAGRLVLDRTFQTQSVDQVFLEPEAGLSWYDAGTRKLELVVGVQSPQQAAASVATLVAE